MDDTHLHPNLAQLAASYDDIVDQWSRGQLSEEQANQRISALVCRDDNGVMWRISPDDGDWWRQTLDGEWRKAEPPQWGVASDSGWDVSDRADAMNDPRRSVWQAPVSFAGEQIAVPQMRNSAERERAAKADDTPIVTVGEDLTGATISAARRRAKPERTIDMRIVVALAVVTVILIAARLAL